MRKISATGGGQVALGESTLFDIVNHLNCGSLLITDVGERERAAELNLIGGKRAKASTAFTSALNYLRAGRSLLG
jgi:predicted ATPase